MTSNRFIICKASAGSGKTYTLVRQFIEIAISAPTQLKTRFERILAITFTNAAANEMKERIMNTLGEIIDGENEELVAEMAVDMGIQPSSRTDSKIASESEKNEVRHRCAVVRSAILHNYSNLSVCTIDSFVLRLVKTFAYDLNLPLNFNVMIDESELLKSVLDNMMALAGTDEEKPLTEMLTSFIGQCLEDGKPYNVERSILTRSEELLKEGADKYLKSLSNIEMSKFLELEKNYRAENRAFERALQQEAQKPVQAAAEAGLCVDDFVGKSRGIYPYFERLANGNLSSVEPSSTVDKTMKSEILFNKTAPQHIRQQIEQLTPTFVQAYANICKLLDESYKQYLTRTLILRNIYELGLLGKLRQLMDEYYKENESVHIAEFNKSIAEVVEHDQTPFVYERIGSRYSNYLIDEFQDTSKLQWRNFLPLLDEALAQRYQFDTAPQGAQSLVVGDAKQAIYRFRQGDVRQFVMLPEVEDAIHGKSLKHNAQEKVLDNNRRTLATVVEFNNALFRWMIDNVYSNNTILRDIYHGLEQSPLTQGGYVQVSFCPDEAIGLTARDIVRRQVEEHGYNYRDIYILSNKRHALLEVTEVFAHPHAGDQEAVEPIPIVSAESFLLGNSKVVMLLRALLGCLHDASDRAQAAQVLTLLAQIRNLTPADTQQWLWHYKESGYAIDKTLKDLGIDFVPGHFLALSLYDCVEDLVRLFALQGKDVAYVASLLNAVASFCQSRRATLGDLLDYLDENLGTLSCTTSDELDAVQLMTVHKSKGLEAPIIIYLMPNRGSFSNDVWVDVAKEGVSDVYGLPAALLTPSANSKSEFAEEFNEEIRLREMDNVNRFYVALTRPEHKLFIVASDATKRVNEPMLNPLRQYLDEHNDQFDHADEATWSVGTDGIKPVKSEKKRKKQPRAVRIDDITFPQWGKRISIAASNESLLTSLALDSRRYGIVVHDLLAHIASPDDAERVVNQYCKQHHVDDADAKGILERIERMLSVPENRRYFDPRYEVRNEVSLLYRGMVLRPDRIVFADDETWVVDFKTGTYDDKSHKQYQQQVATYAAAVAEMGYPSVHTAIVYL
ncbi:MAG: UvrD-helicase domain-containing protein [Bacteroidales bacterium]|nr:UvrD-helicase domain-containing protein [Bacteroidales bacterium]